MSTRVSRRDMLKLMSGVAVGTLFTPVPWKLLDDLAIRTQNEGWIAHPRRGKIGFVPTHCSLCPAGCALNLRCVGDVPISLSAIPKHPLGAGTPCPYGLVLHHFAGHPDRLRAAQVFDPKRARLQPEARWEEKLQLWMREAITRGDAKSVAILDPNPGRALSAAYRSFLATLGGGLYLVPSTEDSLLRDTASAAGFPEGTQLAYELSSCRTILSFSAPILEDWGTPGRTLPRLRVADNHGASKRARLVQVSPIPSVSARLADRWVRIRPGSEAAFTLGIMRVLLDRGWIDRSSPAQEILGREEELLSLVSATSLESASLATGVSTEELERTAWQLAHEGPSLVVLGDPSTRAAADESLARLVFLLNVLLGATGSEGSLRARDSLALPRCLRSRPPVAESSLESVPDASLQLLFIDGSRLSAPLPMREIRRKMAPSGHVVALTPYAGRLARACDLALPTSAPLEGWDEVTAACDLPLSRFAVARPVFRTDYEPIDPVYLLQQLSPDPAFLSALGPKPTYEKLLRDQSDALFELGAGRVLEPWSKSGKAARPASASSQWDALLHGAEWYADEKSWNPRNTRALIGMTSAQALRQSVEAVQTRSLVPASFEDLSTLPLLHRVGSTGEPVPALFAKLCRESTLLPRAGTVYLNPLSARALGLRANQRVTYEGSWGPETAVIHLSERVEPSSLVAATGLVAGVFGDEERP